MKTCSICNQNYNDENLNFCLNDGGVLIEAKDDAPPTIQMNQVRTTQPNWESSNAPNSWQNQPAQFSQTPFQQNQPFAPLMQPGQNQMFQTQTQTLATVSLCLGIAGITIGWCCSLGLVLSPAALITGFIALSQIKKDPLKNGGRGLAIGGIATGAVYLAIFVLILIIYGAAFLINLPK